MTRAPTSKSNRRPAQKPVDHALGLRISTELTAWWYESMNERRAALAEGDPVAQIKPKDVVAVLNRAKVKFVLMGAHAIAGWLRGDARSTMDVDVLIRKRHHKKAVQAISDAFPHLTVEDDPVVTRFKDPALNVVLIDLMKPQHDIHAAVFENSIAADRTHAIPSLEMALASNFAAMVSPIRQSHRKHQDAADFSAVAAFNRETIDRAKLLELGELVYPGGGVELVSLVEDALAGRLLRL